MNLKQTSALLLLLGTSASLPAQTGNPVPQLSTFDAGMATLTAKWQIPGAALAIAKDGRLVFAHGYGLANKETGEPVQPDSLFRIASISKPFTATGVMKLVEAGKLDLDAKVYSILRDLMPPKGQLVDDRLRDITVRDLLRHTGGWDDHARDESTLLLFPLDAADYFGMPSPPTSRMFVRYAYSNIALDNPPATRYAYSNFGYTLLGRVIEEISGVRYVDYIQREVLTPAGISRMAISGNSPDTASPGEVRYYDYAGADLMPSIFPGDPRFVPAPYNMDLRMIDSFGGWAASAIDLVRFSETLDGRRGTALLKAQTIQTVMAHDWSVWPGADLWYGLGWFVQPTAGGIVWFHGGDQPGDDSLLVHWPNGISIAVVFNSRPKLQTDFTNDVIVSLNAALAQVQSWPSNDLFPQYDPPPAR